MSLLDQQVCVAWPPIKKQRAACISALEALPSGEPSIIDFVDTGHPALLRMWGERQRGYRVMEYKLLAEVNS